jgi:hypothetical protein
MYETKMMRLLGRAFYGRKVLGVMAVGSRQVTSMRLRMPVAADKLELYRSLLPRELEMPAAPKIYFYISEFQGTYPVKIAGGYREAAVCIAAGYKGDSKAGLAPCGWYPLEMPVSAESALNSGLIMGYPKYMADITLTTGESGGDGAVKVEGRDFFAMDYRPEEVVVPSLDEEDLRVPFYLVSNAGINIMSNEVVEQNSFTCRTGRVSARVQCQAAWTGLLPGPEVQGPGVVKVITGRFNLTRRSR